VRAVPGLAKLVDEHGAPTPEGDAGELVVRGENLFKGYWKSPGVVDDPKRDGWYHTGDMMRQTEDGEWSYEIRRSDVIVRAGQRLSPVEIARVLMTHPAVADAAVAGVTDPFLGQRVVGFIELVDPSRPCDTNDILGHAAHQLADYKVPEVLAVVDMIPRNGVGKVSRRVLAAMAAQFEIRVGDLE
jgi:acyl-coenzyme A synthetase/AMP-(fatty) acid ligase